MESLDLDLEKTALVVIDLQKGIVSMEGAPYEPSTVIGNAVRLADVFREKGAFVTLVHVDFHDGKDALRPITDQPTQARGEQPEDWAQFVPELGPKKNDLVVTKHQWGAFFGTELDVQLRRRGIDTIVLCGIATNIGVETTAREAYQHNYNQVFAVDAMNGPTKAEHDMTIQSIFPKIGRVRTTEDILQSL